MKYENITEGRFLDRPNRFIAHVEIAGQTETCKEHRQMQGAFDSWCSGFSGKEQ